MSYQHTTVLADAASSSALGLFVVAGLLALAYVVFIISAFVSILCARMDGGMKLVWLIFALCAPFIGSLCWFLIGRKRATEAW